MQVSRILSVLRSQALMKGKSYLTLKTLESGSEVNQSKATIKPGSWSSTGHTDSASHNRKELFWEVNTTYFEVSQVAQNLPDSERDSKDAGSIPRLGRSPGEGIGNLLQYSCLENYTDREAWWMTIHGVTELNMTQHTYAHTHTLLCTFFFPINIQHAIRNSRSMGK